MHARSNGSSVDSDSVFLTLVIAHRQNCIRGQILNGRASGTPTRHANLNGKPIDTPAYAEFPGEAGYVETDHAPFQAATPRRTTRLLARLGGCTLIVIRSLQRRGLLGQGA